MKCTKGNELRALATLAISHEMGLRTQHKERVTVPAELSPMEYPSSVQDPIAIARQETDRARRRLREHVGACRICAEIR